jgi:hypothetical protein
MKLKNKLVGKPDSHHLNTKFNSTFQLFDENSSSFMKTEDVASRIKQDSSDKYEEFPIDFFSKFDDDIQVIQTSSNIYFQTKDNQYKSHNLILLMHKLYLQN